MNKLLQDIRYALRASLRDPAFFLFTTAVLALGIGANTAIFSVAYNILLRPLPYRDASRLVMVWEDDTTYGFPQNTPSPGNFSSWKSENSVFTDVAAMSGRTFDLTGHGNPEEYLGMQVTANMFPLLGVERSQEHTSELQSQFHLICRLLLEKKKKKKKHITTNNKKNKTKTTSNQTNKKKKMTNKQI